MGSKARLDMEHGFMHHIIRNQVDRDNYDKEVKAMQSASRKKAPFQKERVKKPEMSTYVPPPKSEKDQSSASGDVERKILFKFDYEDQHGKTHPINIYQGDDPRQIARRIGNRHNFTGPMIHVMSEFLQEEISKGGG